MACRLKFALIPHQCFKCGTWFWLEDGFKEVAHFGPRWYCFDWVTGKTHATI